MLLIILFVRVLLKSCFIKAGAVEWQLAAVYKECDGRDLDRGRQASVDACASACKKHSTMFTFEEHNQGYCRCQLSAKVDGTCKERDSHGKKLYRYVKGGDMWAVLEESNKNMKELIEVDIRSPSSHSFYGAVEWHKRLWLTREIPYHIKRSGGATHLTANARLSIESALHDLQNISCIRFREKQETDNHWIEFRKGIGCNADIGRIYYANNTPTVISLGDNCLKKSVITHELLHALGVGHEHTRKDRNSYINIIRERIQSKAERNFDISNVYEHNVIGTSYDLESIMQFNKKMFSKGGQGTLSNTIESLYDHNMELGGNSLSAGDIEELNQLYLCKEISGWSRWFDWSECLKSKDDVCQRSKFRYCVGKNHQICNGADINGIQQVFEECTSCKAQPRAVNGEWGKWGDYSTCSRYCGWGIQRRKRECNSPPPKSGGKVCSGLSFQVKVCRKKRCGNSIYDQNFDESFGHWQTNGRLREHIVQGFKRRRGRGPFRDTGPSKDHSTGSGYYAVWPGADGMYDQKAKLISPWVNRRNQKCLIFHYQLNGDSISKNAITVYLETKFHKRMDLPLQISSKHEKLWERAAVTIGTMPSDYKIVIEGRIGKSRYSDVAIDDIFMDFVPCPNGLVGCRDYHYECQGWAVVGECVTNDVFMNRECCASCSKFGECVNKDNNCRKWSDAGGCEKNPVWMWPNCCSSCKEASCVDKADCRSVTKAYCTGHPSYYVAHCCKTCKEHGIV